jgi:hypothetical protein
MPATIPSGRILRDRKFSDIKLTPELTGVAPRITAPASSSSSFLSRLVRATGDRLSLQAREE